MVEPRDARVSFLGEVDAVVAALARETGLGCPSGCGACCANDKPRVSVNDVTPIALSWVARGLGEVMLARAGAEPEGVCVAYAGDAERGQCSEYARRPALCRLFGFGAVRDKRGGLALAACRVHKRTDPEAVARAEQAARAGRAPIFSDVQRAVDGLGRPELTLPLPINEAFARALERALMSAGYAAQEEPEADAPSTPTPAEAIAEAVEPQDAANDDGSPDEPEGSGPKPWRPPLAA